jgi:hypothetical protein
MSSDNWPLHTGHTGLRIHLRVAMIDRLTEPADG